MRKVLLHITKLRFVSYAYTSQARNNTYIYVYVHEIEQHYKITSHCCNTHFAQVHGVFRVGSTKSSLFSAVSP